jgi:peptide methionine sulfoxide reductase MsrB
VDSYTAKSVGLPNAQDGESLSEAICCDLAYRNYAEPNGFYKFYDVALFRKVDSAGVTTFFDSVCGLPVFQAPMQRSFEAWKQETEVHGWPSFRAAEVISENVYVNATVTNGVEQLKLYSKCGTYLGDNLPDETGEDRYCIDLSCISGHSE